MTLPQSAQDSCGDESQHSESIVAMCISINEAHEGISAFGTILSRTIPQTLPLVEQLSVSLRSSRQI
jgi:hypothetical protein